MKKKEETPMKTKEEPTEREEEAEVENNQPRELTEEELEKVSGGLSKPQIDPVFESLLPPHTPVPII